MTNFKGTGGNLSSQFIEDLLYQSESTALDFKLKQYPFNGATEEEKSELLKDILAFANSWRQGDAFILIGVQAVTGGRHVPVGTEEHFDDAQLQQFVNSKTNRKVILSYEVILVEGKKIGVIRIPKQERPVYATKRFGKVEKEVVYYRLGSSTAIAKPEDIARMGKDDSVQSQPTPRLSLQFAELQNRIELGTDIEIASIAFDKITTPFPDAGEKPKNELYFYATELMQPTNKDYWREMEQYLRTKALVKPVGFMLCNQSSSLAQNVRVEIIGSSADGITILEEHNLPEKPAYNRFDKFYPIRSVWKQQQKQTTVDHHGKQWTLTVDFANVQPQSCVWASEPFYIGSQGLTILTLDATIYADNLPTPQKTPLSVRFDITKKPALTINDLEKMSRIS